MLNVAQIGVGYWGPNLLRNLDENDQCEVMIVADLSENRRKFVQKHYWSIITTEDCYQIFDDSTIDAVVIATPANSHFDLVMESLNVGKHVLVEKPMARTVKEVEIIMKTAKEKNLVAMVGHTFLYNSAVRYLRAYIESGELGEVRYIYSQRLNLGRIRSDVDALWNLAPHDVSIIQYLLGNPTPVSVRRYGMDYVQKDIDDVVFMNIEYPRKIMANIHVSWLDPHKIRKTTVVGSRKMIVYDDVADDKIAIYDKGIDEVAELGKNMDYDNGSVYKLSYRSGDLIFPRIKFEEPLKIEIEHFLDCIRNKTECLTGPQHALNVIKILSEDFL